MKEKKKLWFLAFRYIVPADLENFLEKKAAEGWHVRHLGQWSSLLTTLWREEPKKYRFIYDMQPVLTSEYKATYEQFGWELVGQMASSILWRKEYTDERPEAFSDQKSIEQRNKRFLLAVSVSFIIFVLGAIAALISLIVFGKQMETGDIIQLWIMFAFVTVLAFLLGLVMRMIGKNQNK